LNRKEFYDALESMNHSRERRGFFANLIYNQQITIPQVLEVLQETHTKHDHKAAWALEVVCKEKLPLLLPFIDEFIDLLPRIHHDATLRPLAKICESLILAYYHQHDTLVKRHLYKIARQKISEVCLDWMITEQKVAVKAYAIICLFHLGKEFDWIHPELKNILERDYHVQSAAFRARARMVLKKMN